MTHDAQLNIAAILFALMLGGVATFAFRLGALYGRERFKADCVSVWLEIPGTWKDK